MLLHAGVLLLALAATVHAQVACQLDYKICSSPCPSGYKLDDNGCKTCSCIVPTEECPLMKCPAIYCPNGFKKDAQGCQTCGCAEQPDCPEAAVSCMMFCERGFKKNVFGCSTCECEDKPVAQVASLDECPVGPMCLMQCDLGFKKDSKGCPTCSCIEPPNCPEVQVACAMYCQQGYKKDANGCQSCACADLPSQCPPFRCKMYCDTGFKKDASGCELCKCNEPPPANCPPACMMYCEYGFKKDSKGCPQCACANKSAQIRVQAVCPLFKCKMYCETGFKKDGSGCDLCKCNDEIVCPMCAMSCEFGFVRDTSTGCDTCSCLPHPCHHYYCAVENRCVVQTDTDEIGRLIFTPVCVPGRRWCPEKSAMCAMYCANGFQTDKSGCNVCKCQKVPTQCFPAQCDASVFCKFGYSYDENGCQTCQCLMNPCLEKKCPTGNVCEPYKHRDCHHCPRTPRCIGRSDVQRIEIEMNYVHSTVKDLDDGEFENELTKSMSKLLGDVDDDDIDGIEVERVSDGITSVEFQFISNSDPVSAYEAMIKQVTENETQCGFEVDDVKFYPDPATVTASYYSEEHYEDEVHPVDDDNTKMIIIICTVVGASVLVVLSIIIIACICSKKKHKSKENIIYKQTLQSDRI